MISGHFIINSDIFHIHIHIHIPHTRNTYMGLKYVMQVVMLGWNLEEFVLFPDLL